jgi:hypothetical protein
MAGAQNGNWALLDAGTRHSQVSGHHNGQAGSFSPSSAGHSFSNRCTGADAVLLDHRFPQPPLLFCSTRQWGCFGSTFGDGRGRVRTDRIRAGGGGEEGGNEGMDGVGSSESGVLGVGC